MSANRVIDACVHHQWGSLEDVLPYMSRGWQEFVSQPSSVPGPTKYIDVLPTVPYRRPLGDFLPGAAARNPEDVAAGLFDNNPIERVVLSYGDAMFAPGRVNPYLAREVTRATNDWTVERWLDVDDRFSALILVPNQNPADAVAEIERLGDDRRMVGVLIAANSLNKPLGHPVYHPIYEAAARRDLPVVLHSGGDALRETLTHTMAGGIPSSHAEYAVFAPQAIAAHLASFVAQGVFAKYPTLRLLIVGAGAAWLAPILWRFDNDYSAYRREVPWLTRQPSEVIRDHVRISTYPFDVAPDPARLVRYLEAIGGLEELLVYASGYPNWDTDMPDAIAATLPEAWHRRVFRDNALDFFRWDLPAVLRDQPEFAVGEMVASGRDRPAHDSSLSYVEPMLDTE
jgi:predicted TIM-barrel fold metal-dependent hydrolase